MNVLGVAEPDMHRALNLRTLLLSICLTRCSVPRGYIMSYSMTNQTKRRAQVIDWLLDVVTSQTTYDSEGVLPPTSTSNSHQDMDVFFVAVNLFDTVCGQDVVNGHPDVRLYSKGDQPGLQAIGLACLVVAYKMQCRYTPCIHRLCSLGDVTMPQLLAAEERVVQDAHSTFGQKTIIDHAQEIAGEKGIPDHRMTHILWRCEVFVMYHASQQTRKSAEKCARLSNKRAVQPVRNDLVAMKLNAIGHRHPNLDE